MGASNLYMNISKSDIWPDSPADWGIDDSEWYGSQEGFVAGVILWVDDPQYGLNAGQDEVEPSNTHHPVEYWAQPGLHDTEPKAHDYH